MIEQHSVCNLVVQSKRDYHLGVGKKQLLVAAYTFDQSMEDIFGSLILGATLVRSSLNVALGRLHTQPTRICSSVG